MTFTLGEDIHAQANRGQKEAQACRWSQGAGSVAWLEADPQWSPPAVTTTALLE